MYVYLTRAFDLFHQLFVVRFIHVISFFVQARSIDRQNKQFHFNSLSVGNGGSIKSNSALSSTPAMQFEIDQSLNVLPGGTLKGNWINISAKQISIDGSGEITSSGLGEVNGHGSGLGEKHFLSAIGGLRMTSLESL